MCMWGIRAGRQLEAVSLAFAASVEATGTLMAKADPNRVTLVLSLNWIPTDNPDPVIRISSGSRNGPVAAILTAGMPTVTLRVEDHGSLVTNEIWASLISESSSFLNLTALRLNIELEKA